MNRPLFVRTLAANRLRMTAAAIGMLVWGSVLPVIYSTFGKAFADLVEGSPMLSQFAQFGGGSLFSLEGSIALGFVHPFTLLLMGIMAIGFPALAIAGERQRGTLEILLARPISRHALYMTLYVAGLLFLGLLLAAQLAAASVSATVMGVGEELHFSNMVLLWLSGWLLFVAFMSLAFAASVASDRIGPAIGIPLVFVLVNYLGNAIGSIWPDVSWMQDWSMFNLVKAQKILGGDLVMADYFILVAFIALFVGLAWWLFPRRDLSAPS